MGIQILTDRDSMVQAAEIECTKLEAQTSTMAFVRVKRWYKPMVQRKASGLHRILQDGVPHQGRFFMTRDLLSVTVRHVLADEDQRWCVQEKGSLRHRHRAFLATYSKIRKNKCTPAWKPTGYQQPKERKPQNSTFLFWNGDMTCHRRLVVHKRTIRSGCI